MSDQNESTASSGDNVADAVAAVAIILISVATVVYWLSGM